jgi:hypothetical protein
VVTFLIVSAALLAFAAGLILGAAVGSGKARDDYDAGYAAGLREVHGIGGIADLTDYVRMCRSCHWKHDHKADNFGGRHG